MLRMQLFSAISNLFSYFSGVAAIFGTSWAYLKNFKRILRLSFPPPSWGKSNHPGEKFRSERIHATFSHATVADPFESFEVTFIAQLSILKTKTAIVIVFPYSCIFVKWHKTTLATFCFHMPYSVTKMPHKDYGIVDT